MNTFNGSISKTLIQVAVPLGFAVVSTNRTPSGLPRS
jgi:hypothetical protein